MLVALHGVVDLDQGRRRRGTLLFALGLGLGILTKGPVALLDAGLVAVLGPYWSETASAGKRAWYACVGLGVLGGVLMALAWAIPAAIHGGPAYADAIFVRQTVGRVAKSFAHQRPLWWYFMVLPLMLLPWTVAVRAPWRAWRDALRARSKALRFAIAWFVPAFAAFCLVSGKQPHYLLPLLPAVALYLAQVLAAPAARLRGRWFGALLVLAGCVLAFVPYLSAHPDDIGAIHRLVETGTLTAASLHVFAGIWPWWGLAAVALGVFVLWRADATAPRLALATAAAAMIGMLTIAQGVGPYIDDSVRLAAARIRQFQQSGRPIAHLAWHHGLFEFAGRLTQPLEKINYADLRSWCAAHPGGEVVTFYSKYPITAQPDLDLPYRFGHIRFWRAADILTMPPPTRAPGPDEEDESVDD